MGTAMANGRCIPCVCVCRGAAGRRSELVLLLGDALGQLRLLLQLLQQVLRLRHTHDKHNPSAAETKHSPLSPQVCQPTLLRLRLPAGAAVRCVSAVLGAAVLPAVLPVLTTTHLPPCRCWIVHARSRQYPVRSACDSLHRVNVCKKHCNTVTYGTVR